MLPSSPLSTLPSSLLSLTDPPSLEAIVRAALSLAGLRPLRCEATGPWMRVAFGGAGEAEKAWRVLERATRFDLVGDGEAVRVGFMGARGEVVEES